MLNSCILFGENYPVLKNEIINNKNIIYIKSKLKNCKCPNCGVISNDYHATYTRVIQDTPIHNTETWLNVSAYEFECKNKDCHVKTFVEELPFARRNKVKTDALIQFILSISMFLSSSCASLILSFMGVKISADSISDIIKNVKIVDNPDVEEVGIDDVAIRKGQTYATAIYDLKDHHLIALLDGRDADTVKKWLSNHKKIKIVARDRAGAYAEAINEILPNAIQIADRFHLFANLIKYLKDIFYNEIPKKIYIKDNKIVDANEIKKVPVELSVNKDKLNELNYDNSEPLDNEGNKVVFDSKRHNLESKQYKKQEHSRIEKYKMVKKLREKLKDCSSRDIKIIAKEFGISTPTAKKYKHMTDEEVENIVIRKDYKKRKTVIDDYVNIIYKMIIDQIPPEYIIAYILNNGYDGKVSNIVCYIKLITNNNNLQYDYSKLIFIEYKYPDDVTIITRYELFKFILTIKETKKKSDIEKYINIIEDKYPIVTEVKNIFIDFHNTIFSKKTDKLDEFIEKYEDKIFSFCNGLKKDIAPVKNAISSEISSGFVEGNNNKFKLIKRIVYGKMKLVNLFKKSYLCFLATTDNFDIEEIVECVLQNDKK